MVLVKYKGTNPLYMQGYNIQKGDNEIKDDDFYLMMKNEVFSARVKNHLLEVPEGFPLEKENFHPNNKDDKILDNNKVEQDENSHHDELQPLKQVLKEIHHLKDIDYLKNLRELDLRDKVQDAIMKRLIALGEE